MFRLTSIVALSLLSASLVFAQGTATDAKKAAPAAAPAEKAATPQQERMKKCNADATGKKGDERKKFMSSCLSDKPAAAEPEKKVTPQQEKMKKCNADAKGMKGDERKKFMSGCLKG